MFVTQRSSQLVWYWFTNTFSGMRISISLVIDLSSQFVLVICPSADNAGIGEKLPVTSKVRTCAIRAKAEFHFIFLELHIAGGMPSRASSHACTWFGLGSKDCISHELRTIARSSSREPISESARACRSTLPKA